VGGGRPARDFISAARDLGAHETQCDWLGIKMARHNAELLIVALGDLAYPSVPGNLEEFETALCSGRVVAMGGLTPGHSTNAVAALAAEIMGADMLLNATDVEGVYDRDPKERGAKKLDMLDVDELQEILSKSGIRAGEYRLFDPVAARVVARSKITTVIFNGTRVDNVKRIFKGEAVGSVILHGKKG
jgi:uridylate kinase